MRAHLVALGAADAKSAPKTPRGAPSVHLDKAWHGIHFLLTGEAWSGRPPLVNALMGGAEVGPDQGYGAARLVSPADVKAVAEALRPLSPEVFAARYDADALGSAEIYPDVWDEDPDGREYLVHHYEALRDFYLAAAERGDAVLVSIS